jgi:hypothetical protein
MMQSFVKSVPDAMSQDVRAGHRKNEHKAKRRAALGVFFDP